MALYLRRIPFILFFSLFSSLLFAAGNGGMGGSRQERRQLGRGLNGLVKIPLSEVEVNLLTHFRAELVPADAVDVAGRCDACHSTTGERKSCHACGVVRYCNRECQTAGWPSHKLVCKVLAADRAIAAAKASEATSLIPLDRLWPSLRSDGPAEAFEAATHLNIIVCRTACDLDGERGPALLNELFQAEGVASLVASLARGGFGMAVTAQMLFRLVPVCPALGTAVVSAGSLPALVYAIALPFKHAGLADFGGLRAAAVAASLLVAALTSMRSPRRAIIEAGAIPALVKILSALLQEEEGALRWPSRREVCVGAMEATHRLSLVQRGENTTALACIAAGIVPPLVAALNGGDVGVASAAATSLGGLICFCRDSAIAEAASVDPPKIVALLSEGAAVATEGAGLLLNIFDLAQERRGLFIAAGVVPPLVAFLGGEDRHLAVTSATALGALCLGEAPSVGLVLAAGALKPLLGLLKPYRGDDERNGPLAALRCLASGTKADRELVLAGGAARLAAACLSSEPVAGDAIGALHALLEADENEDEGRPYKASLVAQIMEDSSASRLVALAGSESRYSSRPFKLLSFVADVPAHRRALVKAGLLPTLIVALPKEFGSEGAEDDAPSAPSAGSAPLPDDASRFSKAASLAASSLLEKILAGPDASDAIDAALAATGGLRALLVIALPMCGEAGHNAATALVKAMRGAAQRAALLAAGAVPRLLAMVGDEAADDGRLVKLAAPILLSLVVTEASAAGEAAAGGIDAARLRRIAGLPD